MAGCGSVASRLSASLSGPGCYISGAPCPQPKISTPRSTSHPTPRRRNCGTPATSFCCSGTPTGLEILRRRNGPNGSTRRTPCSRTPPAGPPTIASGRRHEGCLRNRRPARRLGVRPGSPRRRVVMASRGPARPGSRPGGHAASRPRVRPASHPRRPRAERRPGHERRELRPVGQVRERHVRRVSTPLPRPPASSGRRRGPLDPRHRLAGPASRPRPVSRMGSRPPRPVSLEVPQRPTRAASRPRHRAHRASRIRRPRGGAARARCPCAPSSRRPPDPGGRGGGVRNRPRGTRSSATARARRQGTLSVPPGGRLLPDPGGPGGSATRTAEPPRGPGGSPPAASGRGGVPQAGRAGRSPPPNDARPAGSRQARTPGAGPPACRSRVPVPATNPRRRKVTRMAGPQDRPPLAGGGSSS